MDRIFRAIITTLCVYAFGAWVAWDLAWPVGMNEWHPVTRILFAIAFAFAIIFAVYFKEISKGLDD